MFFFCVCLITCNRGCRSVYLRLMSFAVSEHIAVFALLCDRFPPTSPGTYLSAIHKECI